MKKLLMVACLLCWSVVAPAQELFTQADIALADCHSPVGIGLDGGFMYVTSMGPTYHEKLDGCIIKYELATGKQEFMLHNQINSPKSLVIFDGKLIFIDPYAKKESGKASIIVADLATNAILGSSEFDAGYPFDILQTGDNEFVVSDSKKDRLYLLTLDGAEAKAEVWIENIPGAKGLAMFEGGVYIAGYAVDDGDPEKKTGMVYRVDVATKELKRYREVATPAKSLNAIAFKDGYMFVGDWGSKRQKTVTIYVYHVSDQNLVAEFKDVTPGSDFVFDGDTLYLTDMTGNKAVKLDIDFGALDALRGQ